MFSQSSGDNYRIYMDYNATTPLHHDVIIAMADAMECLWNNPSSSYADPVRQAISNARARVAKMMGAAEEDIIFTSTGTEANNWIIESVVGEAAEASAKNGKCKPHVITTDIEHDAVEKKLQDAERRGLCDVTRISAAVGGSVKSADIIRNCRPSTCFVSIIYANNETGVVQPISEVGAALSSINLTRMNEGMPRILFHTDAAQAFGKLSVDVAELCVDFLTVVGHKFYGPRSGALYCNQRYHKMRPMFFGGGQERQLRPGTENVVDIVGLGTAAELLANQSHCWIQTFHDLGSYFAELMHKSFEGNYCFNFDVNSTSVLPNTFSFHFFGPYYQGYRVLKYATRTLASTGAACHSGRQCASAVLLNSGLTVEAAENTIRLSIGKDTTRNMLELVVADLAQAREKIAKEHQQDLSAPNHMEQKEDLRC